MERFTDRRNAGRRLAVQFLPYLDKPDVLVLALPRGGIPVGYEIATALGAPFDMLSVRKLGVPGHEELAFGALAAGGIRSINGAIVQQFHISDSEIQIAIQRELAILEQRELRYRRNRTPVDAHDRTVILVDDGMATGETMRAAIAVIRLQQPHRITVAVPVSPPDVLTAIRPLADELVYCIAPEPFTAVGYWYDEFDPVSDQEAITLLTTPTLTSTPTN